MREKSRDKGRIEDIINYSENIRKMIDGVSYETFQNDILQTYGEMRVINKRDDQLPFPTSTLTYSFVDIERSIFTGEPRTCISFGSLFRYSYTFDKGFLYLSQEAFDGDSYTFQKLK